VVEDADFDVRSLALTMRGGASLGAHRHRWGQLVYALSGMMRVSTDETDWMVPATKAIWVPREVRHKIHIHGEVAMRTLYIAHARACVLPLTPAAVAVSPLLKALILHIVDLGMLSPQRPEQNRLACVLIDLLQSARREDLALPLPLDPRAALFAANLARDPSDPRALELIAREAGASLRTLQRLFPLETGLTIEAWRRKARLLRGMACLAEGASVTAAALDCGYTSVAGFISAFSSQFGVTPGRYRGRR
jgi:AraC-like DNA-binding protein